MSAPDILLASRIAAAENIMISSCACKIFCNLKFRQWAEHAEIIDTASQPVLFIFVEILFKFKALGVLMVDSASGNGTFIGTGLVGECHIFQTIHSGGNHRRKGNQCGEWCMTI